MGAFEKADYSKEFLEDLKEGLETSTVYLPSVTSIRSDLTENTEQFL